MSEQQQNENNQQDREMTQEEIDARQQEKNEAAQQQQREAAEGQQQAQEQAIDPNEELDFQQRVEPLMNDLRSLHDEADGEFKQGVKVALDTIQQRFRVPGGLAAQEPEEGTAAAEEQSAENYNPTEPEEQSTEGERE